MSGIIYSKNSGHNNVALGKIDTPVKMLLESEAEKYERETPFIKKVFIHEKSNNFGETIAASSSLGVFTAMNEGARAENDSISETYKKFIQHVTFGKEFTVTQEMVEDAKNNIASELGRRARAFISAYYMTRDKLGAQALINGTSTTMTFAKAKIDLSVYDGKPLFHKAHTFTTPEMAKKNQSNRYWTDLSTPENIQSALAATSCVQRNMLDENGETIEYLSDVILIPGDCPVFEHQLKAVCGTERVAGSANNDINTQYGNWGIVVVPGWRTGGAPKMMVMSSVANRNLAGNLFFNRVPLTINSWQDQHTWDFIYAGRCRFSVGFGSYKHIILCEGAENGDATKLY